MKKLPIILFGLTTTLPQISHAAFTIDFRDGVWDHSAVGGPSASNGWAAPTPSNLNTPGYSAGVTEVETGVFLNVTRTFVGSASTGPNNFRLDPVNTPGFAFQNAGTGDTNPQVTTALGVQTVLTNYQRIDFSFSQKVTLDQLRIGDIDTATSTGTNSQAWRDTVALELWQGSAPTIPGTAIEPNISLAPSTRLALGSTTNGLPFAFASQLGNTSTSNNPILASNTSAATFSYDLEGVDGFSIYLWNRGQGTGGQHAIVLQADGSALTVVPEPSSALLLPLAALVILKRRRE